MRYFLLALLIGLPWQPAYALDAMSQRYVEQMSLGGNHNIKISAQNIYRNGEVNPEVLDVAAEILLQRYPTATNPDIDTLSWVAKALGNSRNPRYFNTLNEVANSNAHAKLRKYAKSAMKQVGGVPSVEQYQRGMVDLDALRNFEQPQAGPSQIATSAPQTPAQAQTAPQAQSQPQASAGNATGRSGIEVIKVGMSEQEVHALIGPPTSTSRNMTGKAFLPFARGAVKTNLFYKGQGRIVCSHDAYSTNCRVEDVLIDPSERGYP